jgi:hypothetical protein
MMNATHEHNPELLFESILDQLETLVAHPRFHEDIHDEMKALFDRYNEYMAD